MAAPKGPHESASDERSTLFICLRAQNLSTLKAHHCQGFSIVPTLQTLPDIVLINFELRLWVRPDQRGKKTSFQKESSSY